MKCCPCFLLTLPLQPYLRDSFVINPNRLCTVTVAALPPVTVGLLQQVDLGHGQVGQPVDLAQFGRALGLGENLRQDCVVNPVSFYGSPLFKRQLKHACIFSTIDGALHPVGTDRKEQYTFGLYMIFLVSTVF